VCVCVCACVCVQVSVSVCVSLRNTWPFKDVAPRLKGACVSACVCVCMYVRVCVYHMTVQERGAASESLRCVFF